MGEDIRVRGDFNGLFGDLLCLSHDDHAIAEDGSEIALEQGMRVTAFEPDVGDDDEPAFLVANGVVEPSPPELACSGSRWALRIDERGVYHEPGVQ